MLDYDRFAKLAEEQLTDQEERLTIDASIGARLVRWDIWAKE